MSDIYITGHKNPDMDSICSAYCYSELKNSIDPHNKYIPIRCGRMNAQTKMIIDKLGVKPPRLLKNIFPHVADVAKRNITSLDVNDPVLAAVTQLDEENISVIPVFENDNEFKGTISLHEISKFVIRGDMGGRPIYHFRTGNFKKVLPGYFYRRGKESEFDAPIMTGAMSYEISKEKILKLQPLKPLLVVGLRENILKEAIDNQFPAIIITGVEKDEEIPIDFSSYKGALFISHIDTAETIRLLRLSTPLKNVMNPAPVRLQAQQSFDEGKDLLVNSLYRGLPVFEDELFSGIVTRRCFIEKPTKKLILMDHNEIDQSIIGAEQAEIVEILDHHRLGNKSTKEPIYVYARPLGSTCTIVYLHYKMYNQEISSTIATLLLSGLLSDTVLLKSPTTTEQDKLAAKDLLELAGLNLKDFGKKLFSQSTSLKISTPQAVLASDFKIYRESLSVGISQVEVLTLDDVADVKENFLEEMEKMARQNKLDWVLLLVTNVIKESSFLLSTPFKEGEEKLLYPELETGLYDLPGILSRKKQLLPEILRVLEEIRQD